MQHISKDKILDIANFIDKKKFSYFSGYCSISAALATQIDEAGISINNPPSHLFTGSEKLFEYQKNIIEKVFKNIQIHEMYSFSEQAAFASHCERSRYHEDFEIGHMELYNIVPHPNGQFGEILATGFMNLGMPFIRYRVGDTAIFSNNKCKCGLATQVIEDIVGRREDIIVTPEGTGIQRLDYIFKGVNGIKEAQLVQKRLGEIIIRIVQSHNYNISTEKELIKNVKIFLSPSIEVKFEYVDEIPRTKAGKFKAVVSELNK